MIRAWGVGTGIVLIPKTDTKQKPPPHPPNPNMQNEVEMKAVRVGCVARLLYTVFEIVTLHGRTGQRLAGTAVRQYR